MYELTSNSCRVCFTRCKRSDMKVQEVSDIFYQSTGSRINFYDIPQKMCETCLKTLKRVHKFKQACARADEFLEGYRFKPEPKIEIYKNIDDVNSLERLSEEKTDATRPKSEPFHVKEFDLDALRLVIQGMNRIPTIIEEFILNYNQDSKSRSQNMDPVHYESDILSQLSANNGVSKFKCLCGSQFPSLDHLRVHNMQKECTTVPTIQCLKCNYCTFTCAYEMNMRYHNISMHLYETPYQCECGEELYCNDSRLEHTVFKCKNRTDVLQIPFKQFIITSEPDKQHVVNVGLRKINNSKPKKSKKEKPPQARVICEQCGKDILKSRLSDHIGAKHNAKRFECDICQSSYVEKANLIRHMFYKHLKNKRQYPCPYCDKIYEQSGSRSLHIKKIHTNDLRHVCNVCGKRFVKPSKLKYHMATHSGRLEKTFYNFETYLFDDCTAKVPSFFCTGIFLKVVVIVIRHIKSLVDIKLLISTVLLGLVEIFQRFAKLSY